MQYDSDYEIRLELLARMGGDMTKPYDSVYSIDEEILRIYEEGGGGGGGTGSSINDNVISLGSTWSSKKISDELGTKQGTLTAGTNITIQNGVISAQGADLSDYYNKGEVDGLLSGKQGTLTAGTGIDITNGVISAESVIDDLHASSSTTYSSNKIVELTQGLGFDIEVVTELPASGAAHTIYLLPKSTSQTNNVYNEYLWTGSAFELIGDTQVDLSQYYTKSETDTLLSAKQATMSAGSNISISSNTISALGYDYNGTNKTMKIGSGMTVNNDYEVAVGTYNRSRQTSTSGNTRFSVGIGTSDNDRVSAMEVMDNGSVFVNGIGDYSGTSISGTKTLQQTVNEKVASSTVVTIWSGTQQQYDALTVKDANTLYIIKE